MTVKFAAAAVAAVFAAVGALPAQAYLTDSGLSATGDASRIVVEFQAGFGDSEYWCAAGDFAISRLGASVVAPVYRVTPPPRKRGQGIVFSLSPEGTSARTGIAMWPQESFIRAESARSMCSRMMKMRHDD